MFGKYNINDLFLACINVRYPSTGSIGCIADSNFDVIEETVQAGYGYLTILKKEEDKYIDLQDMSINITTNIDPSTTSYTIDYIQPLSKYYTQEGKRIQSFSKRKAMAIATQYYNALNQDILADIEEKEKSLS